MRALCFIVSGLLAGSAYAQAPATVYTPGSRDVSVPTFINATVTRVDTRNNTITFRSESRDVSLTVEGSAVARLGRLRAGDDVLLGYRLDNRAGRTVQVVTAIHAGEDLARRGVVAATSPTAVPVFSTLSGRVIRTDTARGTVTLVDAEGRTETLAVDRTALGTLGTVLPGDQVEVSYVPGAPVGAGVTGVAGIFGTVNAIQPVAPAFVTGRGATTTSPAGVAATRTAVGTFGAPLTATRTGTGTHVGIAAAGSVTNFATTGVAAPATTSTLGNAGPAALAAPVQTGTGNVGSVAAGPFGTAGLNGAAANAGVAAGVAGTAGLGATGTISAPGSPYSAVIPSLPSVVGQLNVVAPPQAAPALPEALPVGAARDLATRDYDNAVRTLALKANEIDAHWFRYRDGCLRTSAITAGIDRALFTSNRDREWFVLFDEDVRTPADDNCRQLRVEMSRMAHDWRDLMNRVEDTARRNDVLPGAMRESRQRYRVEF